MWRRLVSTEPQLPLLLQRRLLPNPQEPRDLLGLGLVRTEEGGRSLRKLQVRLTLFYSPRPIVEVTLGARDRPESACCLRRSA